MEVTNKWQPVTDVYQEISDTTTFDADPMTLVKAVRHARSMAEVKAPIGISLITGLYFLRAAIYALFAAKLVASSDSDLSGWLMVHCPALVPFTLGTDPKTLSTSMATALGVMAVISIGMGFLWTMRWKPALFISVALCGFYMVHVLVSYMGIVPLGDPRLFSSEQLDILVLESALNLLVFLFIAGYPNLKNSFRRDF